MQSRPLTERDIHTAAVSDWLSKSGYGTVDVTAVTRAFDEAGSFVPAQWMPTLTGMSEQQREAFIAAILE